MQKINKARTNNLEAQKKEPAKENSINKNTNMEIERKFFTLFDGFPVIGYACFVLIV